MIRDLISIVKSLFTIAFMLLAGLFFITKWLLGIKPKPLEGRAYVLDGDGLAMDGDIRVRFYGLDAPEMDHPEGQASKAFLMTLIGDNPVRVVPKSTDKYGRVVGLVYLPDGTCVNERMVAEGYARAYASFSRIYVRLERKAKREGRGLWGQGGLTLHPELWRKHTR